MFLKPLEAADLRKYIVYGLGVFVTIAAVWLAATDGSGGGHVVTCFLVKTGVGLEVGNNREHVSFKHCECTTNGQLHLSAGSHASATHLSLEARKRAGIPTVPKLQRK